MEWYLKVVRDNYANFNGRARRKEYWMFTLFNLIFVLILAAICGGIAAVTDSLWLISIVYLYLFAILIPSIAVTVRRLHDIGKSGWWILIAFVPLVSIALFVFSVIDSEHGENQWGPNPKGIGNQSDINQIGNE